MSVYWRFRQQPDVTAGIFLTRSPLPQPCEPPRHMSRDLSSLAACCVDAGLSTRKEHQGGE